MGALLVAASVLLSACSSLRIGYNNASDLAYWYLDGFVDFADEQAVPVRLALERYFEWHRATELPGYLVLLADVQQHLKAPTTPDAVCKLMDEATGRLDAAYQQAVPMLADFVLTMSPVQLQNLERRYAKNNREFKGEHLQDTTGERLKVALRRAVERAESLYGTLDAAQKELVAKTVAASPSNAESWFAERRARQADILATVRPFIAKSGGEREAQAKQARAALAALPGRFTVSPRDAYRTYSQRLTRYNCAFAAELHNTTSPAQRQFAIRKVKGWEEDVRSFLPDAR